MNFDTEKSSVPIESQSVPLESLSTPNTTKEDIQALADLKFESTNGKGLTYKDLLKPKYKRANSVKEAQRILKYHKIKGNLYTKPTRTRPQEYFSSKQDAQLAHMNNVREKCSIPNQPMGVTISTPPPDSNEETITTLLDLKQEEIAKADALTRTILNATNGTVPTGMHDIHIHVNLPSQYAAEVYNERLSHVPPQKTKQRAKAIHGRIDDYDVTCLFYPISSKAIITIPCSDKPYPISPFVVYDSIINSEFNDFVAQIRYLLCSRISDYRGVIVPPIHSSRWRFIQADINWDTEITAQEYRIMCNIQLKTWNGVRLQLYKKRIKGGRYYARAEERFHQFSNDNKTASFDANIGSTIKDAIKNAQKEIKEQFHFSAMSSSSAAQTREHHTEGQGRDRKTGHGGV